MASDYQQLVPEGKVTRSPVCTPPTLPFGATDESSCKRWGRGEKKQKHKVCYLPDAFNILELASSDMDLTYSHRTVFIFSLWQAAQTFW